MEALRIYVLYFFFYSALGWLIESIYCSVAAKKWINRGFLAGPICPIYGTGAIVMAVILGPLQELEIPISLFGFSINITPVIVFVAGAILCDIVEFITSVLMEKFFHARWWDYSDKPFNIQGRICLGHTFYWGIAAIAFMYLVHPVVVSWFEVIPAVLQRVLLTVILTVFALDLFNAVRAALDVKKIMDKLRSLGEKLKAYTAGFRSPAEVYEEMKAAVKAQPDPMSKLSLLLQGKYRRTDEKEKLPLKDRIRKSRIGRFFSGYPALQDDVQSRLTELTDFLEETEMHLNGDDIHDEKEN